MRAVNNRAAKDPPSERRSRRTDCLAQALRFQLDACREDEGLAAIVVSDELGFCVAHSGGGGAHDELAAQLPMLADPVRRWRSADGDEPLPPSPEPLVVTTFSIPGATLHACAVGTPQTGDAGKDGAARPAVLERVARGFTRMLAQ
jgi:hypothetical protein